MSIAVKEFKELENQIFRSFYYSNYIPSTVGGSPNTAIMHFLEAIQSIMNLTVSANEINRNWIGGVSWFTVRLEDLFSVPRFEDESDRIYYDRLIDLVDAQQDEGTIKTAINTLVEDAITSLANITFSYLTTAGNWGDDLTPASYQYFWNNTPSDLWGDTNTSLRAVMKITIQFLNKVTDGLVGWWRLDGDLFDSSGNDYDLINTGDVTINTYTKWNFGGIFNGIAATLSLSGSDADNIPTMDEDFSVSIWYKPLDATLHGIIIAKYYGSPNGWAIFQGSDGKVYFSVTDDTDNTQNVAISEVTNDNEWIHATVVWDSVTKTFDSYINGIKTLTGQSTTGVFSSIAGDSVFHIGSRDGVSNYFIGEVDEARVYNTKLVQADVDLLYDYKTTYDYWSASMNYTKIADLIDLYRPPGITYEIELLPPA